MHECGQVCMLSETRVQESSFLLLSILFFETQSLIAPEPAVSETAQTAGP